MSLRLSPRRVAALVALGALSFGGLHSAGASTQAPVRAMTPSNPVTTSASELYTGVTPCRLVDTRITGGSLNLTARNFDVTGNLSAQGGSPLPPYIRPNAKLVQRLRTGHSTIAICGITPDGVRPMLKARAPTSPRGRHLAEMAFLAPDIQQQILSGALQAVPLGHLPLPKPVRLPAPDLRKDKSQPLPVWERA